MDVVFADSMDLSVVDREDNDDLKVCGRKPTMLLRAKNTSRRCGA